eukprot:scaffold30089_cov167-Skeletonema_dohrnii-CCMP3373.AAC.3
MKKEQHQQHTFPFKLYEMIEYACKYEFISSLSWSVDGSIFIIHDKDAMMGDLAPMFFKQTKFRSFTRQLNLWGFVRTETLGGERGGWQHENFIRGRHDLLKEIERTEIKSGVKMSSSITKAQASSRSAGRAAKSEKEVDVLADENSQASISSYKDVSAHVHNTGCTASPVMHAPQVSDFQHSDRIPVSNVIYEEQSKVLDVVSLSLSSAQRYSDSDESSSSTTTAAEVANSEHAEAMYSHDQPFSVDDMMYLASIFENDKHQSHVEDLCSILSLNEETSVEDYSFNL